MTREKLRIIKARRDALDSTLHALKKSIPKKPKSGWIATVRETLGMSVGQLAKRASLDPTTVSRLEANEAKEVITLKSLNKLADALECTVVYTLVPRTSLKEILEDRAKQVIDREEKRTEKTMALEEQGGGMIDSDFEKALLIGNLDKRLWEDE